MKDRINPEITPDSWGLLPYPFQEMVGAPISVSFGGAAEYSGKMSIDRHPTNDELFSIAVVIDMIPVDASQRLGQLRMRLSPDYAIQVTRHPTSGDEHHFCLAIPSDSLDLYLLPRQIRG